MASRHVFLGRIIKCFGLTLVVVVASLGMGSWGYHYFGGCDWVDALYNAAMILTGMGPVTPMLTTQGKLFATFYALYSGIAFLSLMAILLTPIYHRFLHRFHLESEQIETENSEK